MTALAATKIAAGGALAPLATDMSTAARTTTDVLIGVLERPPKQSKDDFNRGRHKWLSLVARDAELPGAAVKIAVLMWELMNAERGYAWPSFTYIAQQLSLNRSTATRAIKRLEQRGWITRQRRFGQVRSNAYRISFGSMDDDGSE